MPLLNFAGSCSHKNL